MASKYVHGSMPVDGHGKTFDGFIRASAYTTAFCVVALLLPILVFSVNMSWAPALLVTFIVGVIIAPFLKLGGGWYASLVGMAIVTAILCMIF